MADLIDRQEAIDAINALEYPSSLVDVKRVIVELPSAQFATDINVGDTISRKMAIDEVKRLHDVAWANWKETRISANTMIDALKDLPSAQPERKKGKWISNDNGTYSCSVCQSWIPEEQHCYARYCLYCGADMRGESDGTD